MKPFRFLHIADVHLDTSFLNRDPDVRRRLRESVREAFRRAVDLSLREEVHALLIPGDLFDNDRLSLETERFLVEEFLRLGEAGIEVFYATGNHDPGRANYRAHGIPWPSNVNLFLGRTVKTVTVRNRDGTPVGRVTAVGHQTPREAENLAAAYSSAEQDLPHVAMLHAFVTDARTAEIHDRYAPCSLGDLKGKGYSYWALGHIHLRQQLLDDPPVLYPGNLQGRNFRESGPKGALLVEIVPGQTSRIEFRELAPVQWANLWLDGLGDVSTLQALRQKALEAFRLHADGHSASQAEWLLRVGLRGPCPLYQQLRDPEDIATLEEELAEAIGALAVEVRLEGLTRPIDVEKYRQGPHILATALDLIEQAEVDDELLDELAPEVIAGAEGTDSKTCRKYLRALLEGLDQEATARMVKEGP